MKATTCLLASLAICTAAEGAGAEGRAGAGPAAAAVGGAAGARHPLRLRPTERPDQRYREHPLRVRNGAHLPDQ